MAARRYSQSVLAWDASEGLCYLYGCAHMVLVVSPLCDTKGAIFMSLLLGFMAAYSAYRLTSAGQLGLLKPMLKPVVLPTALKWGAGLGTLAVTLKYFGLERLEPDGFWPEIIETLAYLAVMAYIMVLTVPLAFSSRFKDIIESAKLAAYERRTLQLYCLVVFRFMLHKNDPTDWFQADYLSWFHFTFLAICVFLTSFVWRIGFQAAKFE